MTRILGLLLAAATLAACGSSPAAEQPSPNQQDNAQNTARTKLQQCLREQGIDIKNGDARQGDREQLQAATQGPCKRYMQGAFGTTNPATDPAIQDALTKFRACMHDHGVDVGKGAAAAARLDPDDPKVAAATNACRDQLPSGLRGGR